MAQKKHIRQKIVVLSSGFAGDIIAHRIAKSSRCEVITLPKGVSPLRPAALKKFFVEARPSCVINAWADTGGIGYVVSHQADLMRNNARAIISVYEAVRFAGVKKVVNCISNSTYPESNAGLLSESDWWSGPWHPSVIPIASSGKHAWAVSCAYAAQYSIEAANLVIGNVYGPGDCFDEGRSYALQGLVVRIVKAQRAGEKSVAVFGTGAPVRDWLYGDDLGDAALAAVTAKIGPDPINIGSGTGISIRDLACYIGKIVGYKGSFVFDVLRPDGAPRKVMDVGRAMAILKWKPRTALPQGLKKTIVWYLKNQK